MILLVIDMQKALVCDELYACDTLVKRISKLVSEARRNNLEVIFFKHDAGMGSGLSVGDDGFEMIDEIKPLPTEKVYIKTINSCFGNQEFKNYLKTKADKRLMIVGLQTNYCIDATLKSAFERGYEVIIPEGTNSTFDNDYMSAEVTVHYYNDDVWDGMADKVSFNEAIAIIKEAKN